ncbi:uncharacterized protein T551_02343 [Pneumocystis jirovecii RU7]|uniref:RRM domain-containing protein n=1 Tax=Pneumocystis jirovecii (strain RU7) TaxID=1408657 RepID=A0A0W4ZL04_PNEJ7|nr:uncharacterized protein T551_02343 [Pneumocystis jirovecii RU7]KTW29069.1 hypothetical protein T551_02343 [Pneumocystis jirovecii RU7]
MNTVREIARINAAQIGASESESWHAQYKDSAYIYIGGLPYDLTEGDIICIFSQYGEPLDINLIRDKKTGKSKGFCFLKYEDQRSTILAVDNLSGAKVLGRTLKVDHVLNYRHPKQDSDDEQSGKMIGMNAAPPILEEVIQEEKKEDSDEEFSKGIDPEDPLRSYIIEKRRKEARRLEKKKKRRHSKDQDQKTHRSDQKDNSKKKT